MKRVTLADGGGGLSSRRLIEEQIVTRFGDGPLRGLPDAATLPRPPGGVVFSTDSFVVQPLEFPGGNIGHLAVYGTVNDLAVAGGRPRWLSLGLVLEEGLPLATLGRVLDAVAAAAEACGVQVVTGDTKVVPRGLCDGMYVNTAGIGDVISGLTLDPSRMQPGDRLLVSGTLGDHGMAVLSAREGFDAARGPLSDTGPVHRLVEAAAVFGGAVRFMRDPTRGGLATVLTEAVSGRSVGALICESRLPFAGATRSLAELLGIDLTQVACEGRVLAVCEAEACAGLLEAWRALPEGQGAAEIGEISREAGRVVLETAMGGRRLVDVPRGELLPRIC